MLHPRVMPLSAFEFCNLACWEINPFSMLSMHREEGLLQHSKVPRSHGTEEDIHVLETAPTKQKITFPTQISLLSTYFLDVLGMF